MACCKPLIQFFSDVLTSTVAYPATLRAALGSSPRVDVWYFDTLLNEYYTDNGTPGSGTQVKFDGANINIDHGGLASGYIKVS